MRLHVCQLRLNGRTRKKKGNKVYTKRQYVCSAYNSQGLCKHNSVEDEDIHRKVVAELVKALQHPRSVSRVVAMMNARIGDTEGHEDRINQLTRQLAELDRKIGAGTARVVEVPEHMLEAVYELVGDLKNQRHAVEAELANVKSQKETLQQGCFTEEEVRDRINRMVDELESLDPVKVQAMLKANVEKVTLRFETIQKGKRHVQKLVGGEIHLVTEKEVAGTGFEPATSRL